MLRVYDTNELFHYGTPRHSGRYPYGSGDNPYQHNASFLKQVHDLKKQGKTDAEIAKIVLGKDSNSSELRAKMTVASNNKRSADVAYAEKLKAHGYSNSEIGRKMGINESSVRSLLNPSAKSRENSLDEAVRTLKAEVDKKRYLDVGAGTEYMLNGVSKQRLTHVVNVLKEQGYKVHSVDVEQMGTGKKTTMKVLGTPDTEWKEVVKDPSLIKEIQVANISTKDGNKLGALRYPQSIDSSRVMIKYAEDGGADKDGVIELRKGVEDISLDKSMYAQVRIAVDDKYFMKGMAMYSDNMPPGIDIIYNSNKKKGTPPEKVYKEFKEDRIDPNNPFGASIKLLGGQREYTGEDGKQHLSVINKVNEEGDWSKWSKTLASQMLSKQPNALISKQLDLSYAQKKQEFDEIMQLTNPAVKRRLLEPFADSCDSAAVNLKAAALPRQASHVILPINSLKDNEIYAPNYKNGETVVLIRYPHGGKFEIPELTVNNKNKEANSVMHNAMDAVGINSNVAQRLSGADFDGDTVLVIPNNNHAIKTSAPLKELMHFDTKSYGYSDDDCLATGKALLKVKKYDDRKDVVAFKEKVANGYSPTDDDLIKIGRSALTIKAQTKQTEMGKVTNLITDMTLRGAEPEELARAVKHSMVVIDSEKHSLDYKKSEIDNSIAQLKAKYQGGEKKGASTLISRAKAEYRVDEKRFKRIDPETGKKVFEKTGRGYFKYDKDPETGEITKKEYVKRKTISTQMAERENAFDISSGHPKETLYAKYANNMKDLANLARKESLGLKVERNPSAAKVYEKEVADLQRKLDISLMNAPYERQAQIIANTIVSAAKADNPSITKSELKKVKGQALVIGRQRAGAGKQSIEITPREWEAIQAGAISNHKLKQILDNTNLDKVKEYATPRTNKTMTSAKEATAKALAASGYTTAEIADKLGVSTSTITKALKKGSD